MYALSDIQDMRDVLKHNKDNYEFNVVSKFQFVIQLSMEFSALQLKASFIYLGFKL